LFVDGTGEVDGSRYRNVPVRAQSDREAFGIANSRRLELPIPRQFLGYLLEAIRKFYGEDPQKSPDYGRVINRRNFDRLVGLLGSGKIAAGGRRDHPRSLRRAVRQTQATGTIENDSEEPGCRAFHSNISIAPLRLLATDRKGSEAQAASSVGQYF
jgi:hypothetical protein